MASRGTRVPNPASLPSGYNRLLEQGIVRFEPWELLVGTALVERLEGLKRRYPERELLPYARRTDCDDVACVEGGGTKVVIVHDFSSSGFERRGVFPDFWSWFRAAIDEMIEFDG